MLWENRIPGKAGRGEDIAAVVAQAERDAVHPSENRVRAYRIAGGTAGFLTGVAAAAFFTKVEMPPEVVPVFSILAALCPYAFAEQHITDLRKKAASAKEWLEQHERYKDMVSWRNTLSTEEKEQYARSLFYSSMGR